MLSSPASPNAAGSAHTAKASSSPIPKVFPAEHNSPPRRVRLFGMRDAANPRVPLNLIGFHLFRSAVHW
jgi:hypothetical protein